MVGVQGLSGTGGVGRVAGRVAARRGSGGFVVPEEGAAPAQGAVEVQAPSLVGLQELGQEAVQDRAARRHGGALLDALRAVQLGLLGGDGGEAAARLESLVRAAPTAVDARLAGVQRALLVRAAVERARAAASG